MNKSRGFHLLIDIDMFADQVSSPFSNENNESVNDKLIGILNSFSLTLRDEDTDTRFNELMECAITSFKKFYPENDIKELRDLIFSACLLLDEDLAVTALSILHKKLPCEKMSSISSMIYSDLLDIEKFGGNKDFMLMSSMFIAFKITSRGQIEVAQRSDAFIEHVELFLDLKRSSAASTIKLLLSYAMTSPYKEDAVTAYQVMDKLFDPYSISIFAGNLINTVSSERLFYENPKNKDLDFLLKMKKYYNATPTLYQRNLSLFFTYITPLELNPLDTYIFATRNEGGKGNTLKQMHEQVLILDTLSTEELVGMLNIESEPILQVGMAYIMGNREVSITTILRYASDIAKIKITSNISRVISPKNSYI